MVYLMQNEYDSSVRQKTIQAEIERVCLHPFMSDNEISSVSDGLNKIVDHTITLTPKDPPHFRDEQHKVRHLRYGVLSATWTQPVKSQLSISELSFNRFVVALLETLQLADESGSLTKQTQYQKNGRMPRRIVHPNVLQVFNHIITSPVP